MKLGRERSEQLTMVPILKKATTLQNIQHPLENNGWVGKRAAVLGLPMCDLGQGKVKNVSRERTR